MIHVFQESQQMNNSLKAGADVVVDISEKRGADCIRKSINPPFLLYCRQIPRATLSAAMIMGYMVGEAVKSG